MIFEILPESADMPHDDEPLGRAIMRNFSENETIYAELIDARILAKSHIGGTYFSRLGITDFS
jgi:hypothetical protein